MVILDRVQMSTVLRHIWSVLAVANCRISSLRTGPGLIG